MHAPATTAAVRESADDRVTATMTPGDSKTVLRGE
jgi:hypothetical protein